MAAAMISPAAASIAEITDGVASEIAPGDEYRAYNFTFTNTSDSLDSLTWFNITEWNASVTNPATIDDIVNISVWNITTPGSPIYLNHNANPTGLPINITITAPLGEGATVNISVNVIAQYPVDLKKF
ncbi:MAG: hypothetical protein QMD80_08235 [archaeon]|nr:hypothetical protein [archaeon]